MPENVIRHQVKNRTGCPILALLFNIVLEILGNKIRQKLNNVVIRKEEYFNCLQII